MTEPDVRELYRSHEHLVDGAAERLLPAVRERRRRRKIKERTGYASVALAVAATIVAVVVSVPGHQVPATTGVHPIPPGPVGTQTAPAGYRIESSLGLQLAVPDFWQTNDFGCGQDNRPTVVRGQGAVLACLTPMSDTKEFAEIEMSPQPLNVSAFGGLVDGNTSGIRELEITIGGAYARRADGPIGGGRFAGWIDIPNRQIVVVARANSEQTLLTILDSAQLVAIDHFGCATAAPSPRRPAPPPNDVFVDPAPAAVSVCFYGGSGSDRRLRASTQRTGSDATFLAAGLNDADVGSNPDHPKDCLHTPGPQPVDVVLLFEGRDGTVQKVNASFQMCVGVHLDNGREYRRLTDPLLELIMRGMYAGYTVIARD